MDGRSTIPIVAPLDTMGESNRHRGPPDRGRTKHQTFGRTTATPAPVRQSARRVRRRGPSSCSSSFGSQHPQMMWSVRWSGVPNRCAVMLTACSRTNGSSSMRPASVTGPVNTATSAGTSGRRSPMRRMRPGGVVRRRRENCWSSSTMKAADRRGRLDHLAEGGVDCCGGRDGDVHGGVCDGCRDEDTDEARRVAGAVADGDRSGVRAVAVEVAFGGQT